MSELTSFLSQIGGALSAQATGGQQGLQNFLNTVARQQEQQLANQQRSDEQLRQQIFQKGRDERQQAHEASMMAFRAQLQKDLQASGQSFQAGQTDKQIQAQASLQASQQEFTTGESALDREQRADLAADQRTFARSQAVVARDFSAEQAQLDRGSREKIAEANRAAQFGDDVRLDKAYAQSLQATAAQSPEGEASVRALLATALGNPPGLDKIDLKQPESLALITEAVKRSGGRRGAASLQENRSDQVAAVDELGQSMYGSAFRLDSSTDPFAALQNLQQQQAQLQSHKAQLGGFDREAQLLQEKANELAKSNQPAESVFAQLEGVNEELSALEGKASEYIDNIANRQFLNPGAALDGVGRQIGQGIDGASNTVSLAQRSALHSAAQQWQPRSGMDNFPLIDNPNVEFVDVKGAVEIIGQTQTDWKTRAEAVSTFSPQDYADATSPAMQALVSSGITLTDAESFELQNAQKLLDEYPGSNLSDLMFAWYNSSDPQERDQLNEAIKSIGKVNPDRVATLRGVTDHYNREIAASTKGSRVQITDTQGPLLRPIANAEDFGAALEKYGTPNSSVVQGVTVKVWDETAFNSYVEGESPAIANQYLAAARGDVDLALELFSEGQSETTDLSLTPDVRSKVRREMLNASGLNGIVMEPAPELTSYDATRFKKLTGGNGREAMLPEQRAQRSQQVIDSVMSPRGISITERARELAVSAQDSKTMFGQVFAAEEPGSENNRFTLRDIVEIFSEAIPQVGQAMTYPDLRDAIPSSTSKHTGHIRPSSFEAQFAYGSSALAGSGSAGATPQERAALLAADTVRSVDLERLGKNLDEDTFQMLSALQEQLRSMDRISTLQTFGSSKRPGVGLVIPEDADITGTVRQPPSYSVYSQEQFTREQEEIRKAQVELQSNRALIDTVVDTTVGDGETYTLFREAAMSAEEAVLGEHFQQLEAAKEAQEFARNTTVLPAFTRVARRAIADGATNLPAFVASLGEAGSIAALSGAGQQQFMGDISPLAANFQQLSGEGGLADMQQIFSILREATPKSSARGGAAPRAAVEGDFLRAVEEHTGEAFEQYLDIYRNIPSNTPASRFRPAVAERLADLGYDSVEDREMRSLLIWTVLDELRGN